ncbi:MAG: hypothetical protein IPK99_13260 [Flavobacteriales bacterium]|nr:hypothetical protein [Flavobacteriales bacterium]
MRRLFLSLLLVQGSATAQVDLPVFGKQDVINGYAKDIEGEVLSYFSVYPEHATTALLTRCTDGKKAIAWETAAVPFSERESTQYFYFSWIAAHNSTTSGGDRSFDLYINDAKALTFTTHHSTKPGSWSAAVADSTKLVFEYSKMDRHGDAHGFAHLRVPRKYVKLGEPVKLKVVGHPQNSPDWFMTFRYTFEEKVEVEVLPLLTKDSPPRRAIQITIMHFGPPTTLTYFVGKKDLGKGGVPIHHGLQVIEGSIWVPTSAAMDDHDYSEWEAIGGWLANGIEFDTLIRRTPTIRRDIHLIHHSHTDIGYSHLQAEVETIQNNNIFKALELIDRTKDYPEDSRFVWNVESLWAVENFLGIASEADKQRFIAAVKSGSIALSANYANILTGLCTPEEMHWIVEYADSLRKWYDLPITMAMQTDIPGMSWSMVDAYAAHGIRHLSQGPNYIPDMPDGGDRIGSTLREQGDKPYWWKGTTTTGAGRSGQHPRVDSRSGLRRLARLHSRGDQGTRHAEDRRLHERPGREGLSLRHGAVALQHRERQRSGGQHAQRLRARMEREVQLTALDHRQRGHDDAGVRNEVWQEHPHLERRLHALLGGWRLQHGEGGRRCACAQRATFQPDRRGEDPRQAHRPAPALPRQAQHRDVA